MSAKSKTPGKKRYSQSEFPFGDSRRKSFRGHKPSDLGKLPASVLCLSPRGNKWLRARKVKTVAGLVEIVAVHMLAKRCLDQGLRMEITKSLKPFWNGHSYRSIVAVSLLSCGVERVLGDRETGSEPVSVLGLSGTLKTWLSVKNIDTLRDLLLMDEEVLRGSRKLGTLFVDEIIVELVKFLSK